MVQLIHLSNVIGLNLTILFESFLNKQLFMDAILNVYIKNDIIIINIFIFPYYYLYIYK